MTTVDAGALADEAAPDEAGVVRRIVDAGVPMTARDGVVLRAVVHRLATRTRQPVVLVRNPYGEPLTRNVPVAPLLAAGFAVVIQDCRGTGDSDGDHVPFENEGPDTVDAIAWCAAQGFCDGTVVTYGQSYSGMLQLAAAVEAPPALAGIVPVVAPADYQTGVAYRGGAMQLGQLTGWYTMKSLQELQYRAARGHDERARFGAFARHAADPWASVASGPLAEAPVVSEVLPTWRRWLAHEQRDAYWDRIGYRDRRDAVAVPALHIGGWFDLFLGGTLDNFSALRAGAATPRAREGQRLVVGPWQHTDQSGNIGDLGFGAGASAAGVGLEGIVAGFAAAAAAGADIPGPPVRIYVMHRGWRDEQEWPLARTEWTDWHCQPDGTLAPSPVAGEAEPSAFVHDPADPVPMVGGQSGVFHGGIDGGVHFTAGPRDQRPLDGRDDVLRFVSAPLERDLELTGPVTATVYASTTAEDADVVARLIDVYPDGRAIGLVDGITRGRYRHGQDRIAPVGPGEVEEYRVDLWATSVVIRAGHRLRLDIAGSSSPNWDANPGILEPIGTVDPADRKVATQRIFHDALHPTRVTLPVIPE